MQVSSPSLALNRKDQSGLIDRGQDLMAVRALKGVTKAPFASTKRSGSFRVILRRGKDQWSAALCSISMDIGGLDYASAPLAQDMFV